MGLTAEQVRKRPELLDTLVSYHLLPLVRSGESMTQHNISRDPGRPTIARSVIPGFTLRFWQTDAPTAASDKSRTATSRVFVQDVQGNNASVSGPGIVAGNTTVFCVDRVLLNGEHTFVLTGVQSVLRDRRGLAPQPRGVFKPMKCCMCSS